MNVEVKALVAERAQVKASMTRFYRYAEGLDSSTEVDIVQNRLNRNIDLLDKFEQLQGKLEIATADCDADEAAKHEEERSKFEKTYYEVVTKVQRFIRNAQPQIVARSNSLSVASNSATPTLSEASRVLKLPTISLPEFSGDRDTWVRFRESFESLIHDNDSLTNIQKFHYLNSAVSGVAARSIRSLGISDANYAVAWQALKKRFEDPNSLINHHTKALFELPSLTKTSHVSLRELIDDATNHLAALRALGEPTEYWDTLLLRLISSKLDNNSKTEWKKHAQTITSKRRFTDLIDFLEKHCRLLEESANDARSAQFKSTIGNSNSFNKRHNHATSLIARVDSSCAMCKGNHLLSECTEFAKLSLSARRSRVQRFRVCFNCLQPGHMNKQCTQEHCTRCGKNHHVLIHIDYSNPSQNSKPDSTGSNNVGSSTQAYLSHSNNSRNRVVWLSTAIVYIRDAQGRNQECRALLDQGSQANFMTEALCRKLRLPTETVSTSISGIGRTSQSIQSRAQIQLSSRINSFQTSLSCLIIPKISDNIPNFAINKIALPIPEKFTLADPQFFLPSDVDLLIGNGLLWDLICVGQHRMGRGFPLMQKTQLGWILAGEMDLSLIQRTQNVQCHMVTNNDLDQQLQRFWKVEEIAKSDSNFPPINSCDPCEIHFQRTTSRDQDGRYVVSLPFTDRVGKLGESRQMAEKRLLSIERKFERQQALKHEYAKFMNEYEQLGHMTEITDDQIRDGKPSYYLPHHAVYKATSSTTKLRVVFDGSAKTSSGISLNQIQRVGPVIQDDLMSIVLRFRQHRYVISADVAKMYRQVRVKPDERRFQRILWRTDSSLPMRTYELSTVTYGTASAPFLATRVLRHIGEEHTPEFPRAGQAIICDFYVDDLLTGANTMQEARTLRTDISKILSKAGLELRKWASNDPRVLEQGDGETTIKIDADKDPKTLGLYWNTNEDSLRYKVRPSENQRITKRTILSEIAQIFDPLGLVGPTIIKAKILMQQLWQLKTSWDESLPLALHTEWKSFRNELISLNKIQIRRFALTKDTDEIQIHGFCDASERAYGACVYLRSRDKSGQVKCNLLCAKSRVAPLKTISLPRLELCGALLLAQLIHKVRSALQLDIRNEYYWTDSTITLAWIKGSPGRWKTFVANRTTEIQERTTGNWRHVSSEDNPADIISRGINPAALATADIWWHGPSWLSASEETWPGTMANLDVTLEERKEPTCAMVAMTTSDITIMQRYSCISKMSRIVAYCMRFFSLLKTRINKKEIQSATTHKQLTVQEIVRAERLLIRMAQQQQFTTEIHQLSQDLQISRKSRLLSLHPFLDETGLLRVGGRLKNAPIPYDQRHPVILPANHRLTKLLIQREHIRLLHAGCHAVMASLRTKYWPLACKNTTKGVIKSCVRCFRCKPSSPQYLMGQLPAARVTPSRPFTTCGIDYAGPFLVKEGTRARVSIKAYLCIFICLATKAVHLELATDLSTKAFLNCLKRFMARRGRCRHIYSDNGTNFIGAQSELRELGALLADKTHNARTSEFLASEQVQWHLIPPGSPNFGGLWESGVKSAKYHLKRVIGETRLTFEEMYTVLAQIESCMNSRPISPFSDDPNDLTALTPGHFLIGEAPATLPHPDLRDVKVNRLTRFQLLQQLTQHFWSRWQKEYLHQLQQRNKWRCNLPIKLGPGTLVIIREDNVPPLRWRLGRITEIHPGKDDITRVVSIRTSTDVIKRPVSKICPLPSTEENDI